MDRETRHIYRPAIAEYRAHRGNNGTGVVTVRLHSRLAALSVLGRHLGLFDHHADRVTLAQLSRNQTKRKGDTGSGGTSGTIRPRTERGRGNLSRFTAVTNYASCGPMCFGTVVPGGHFGSSNAQPR
jgi:hypothetical protein